MLGCPEGLRMSLPEGACSSIIMIQDKYSYFQGVRIPKRLVPDCPEGLRMSL
jgi:hypothetical protein